VERVYDVAATVRHSGSRREELERKLRAAAPRFSAEVVRVGTDGEDLSVDVRLRDTDNPDDARSTAMDLFAAAGFPPGDELFHVTELHDPG
jgi:hypothetical protein